MGLASGERDRFDALTLAMEDEETETFPMANCSTSHSEADEGLVLGCGARAEDMDMVFMSSVRRWFDGVEVV